MIRTNKGANILSEWLNEYEPVIRPYLPLLDPGMALTPDSRLPDLGLDSMGTVSLLIELEDAFDVSIPDDLLTASTFDTPAALRSVIDSLRDSRSV
jgi:acyl carrier protein